MKQGATVSCALLLRMERERRTRLRERLEVLRWEELPTGERPPMLLVYIGELDLIVQAIAGVRSISIERAEGEVDTFLTGELVSAPTEGMRYLIDVQDAANRRMRWRKQVSYFAAGYTSTIRGIELRLNATPEEVKAKSALLPTEFVRLATSPSACAASSRPSERQRSRLRSASEQLRACRTCRNTSQQSSGWPS